jgi:hypothetical protein
VERESSYTAGNVESLEAYGRSRSVDIVQVVEVRGSNRHSESYSMAEDARNFFESLGAADVTEVAAGAAKGSCAAKWRRTEWYTQISKLVDVMDVTSFVLGKLSETADIAAVQAAASEMVKDIKEDGGEPSQDAIKLFKTILVVRIGTARVDPPKKLAGMLEGEQWPEEENWEGKAAAKWTQGLLIKPQEFVKTVIGRRINAVKVDGSAHTVVENDGESDSDTEREVKKKKVIAQGRKRSAEMLTETQTQMPQVTGVSMPVYADYEGAELLEVLTKKQETSLLTMFAYAKNLARPEKGAANQFLQTLEEMNVSKSHLDEVRKLFKPDDERQSKTDRQYGNGMIVVGDMMRRSVVAQRREVPLTEEKLEAMEKAAAIITRLGTHKLQQVSTRPVAKFCELFGMAQTEDIERMIVDPTMMTPDKRTEVRKKLKEMFDLKKAISGAGIGNKHLGLAPPLKAEETRNSKAQGDGWYVQYGKEQEWKGEQQECPTFGERCYDLQKGYACTHLDNAKRAKCFLPRSIEGKKKGKEKGKEKGKGKGKGKGSGIELRALGVGSVPLGEGSVPLGEGSVPLGKGSVPLGEEKGKG